MTAPTKRPGGPGYRRVEGMCSWHRPLNLGYVASSEEADRRLQRGMRQIRCQVCGRWLWSDEMGKKP